MKNLMKYGFVVLMAVLGLTSCDKDDDYKMAAVSGNQVFFDKSLPTTINLSLDESTFTVPVTRYVVTEAQTVGIELTDTNNVFSIPAAVDFAAGDTVTTLTVSYDPSKLEYNKFLSLELKVNDADATPYGNQVYAIRAGVPLTYSSLGKGTYVDNVFDYKAEVTIEKCDQQEGVYRVVRPYAQFEGGDEFEAYEADKADPYLVLNILKPGQTLGSVTVTEQNLVYYDNFATGSHDSSYDDYINLLHPSKLKSYASDEQGWLQNVVKSYQDDGNPALIQLAPSYYMFSVGGFNYTQYEGVIEIYFPGNEPKDYDVEASYAGIFTNVGGEVFAVANVDFGADIEAVKAVVVSAKEDAEEVALAVAAGELEAVDLEQGSNNIAIPDGLTGKLQVVIVALAEGEEGLEVVNYDALQFEYYGGGRNPWVSIGTGQFTENFVVTMYSPDNVNAFEPITYDVEIEENEDEPGLYRIVDAYAPVAEYLKLDYQSASLEVNATDPEGVYILMQSTGLDDGDGLILVGSLGGYFASRYDLSMLKGLGYLGTLKDGVITLPSVPSDDETYTTQGVFAQGNNAWDTGVDTEFRLVLPTAAAARAAKAAQPLGFKVWKKARRHAFAAPATKHQQLKFGVKLERLAK